MGSSLNLHVTNSPNIMFNLWEVGLLGIVMTWICDLWFLCSLFHMRLPVLGISRCSVSVFEDVILYMGHLILGRNSCCYPPNHDQGSTAGWQSAARGVTTTCFMCIHRIFSWLLLGLHHVLIHQATIIGNLCITSNLSMHPYPMLACAF